MENEFEKFLEPQTLIKASRNAGLLGTDDENIEFLKKVTTISTERGTDFINVTVKHESKVMAAALANSIAQATIWERTLSDLDRNKKISKVLHEEIEAQKNIVRDHRAKLREYLKLHQLPYPDDGHSFPEANEIRSSGNMNQAAFEKSLNTYQKTLKEFHTSRSTLREMSVKHIEARKLLAEAKPSLTFHQRAD